MPHKILLGLIVLAALIEGLAPGAVPQNILPLALVILGIVVAIRRGDAEPTPALVVAIAAAVAGEQDVLNNIHVIGGYLDGILDAFVVAALSGAATIVGMGIYNQLTASDDSE